MSWPTLKLIEMCDLKAGSAFKLDQQGSIHGDVPFIKVSDFNDHGNEISIHGARNWVSHQQIREMKAKPFPAGTTVFAKIGEALKQNRVRKIVKPTAIDNNLMGAIPRIGVVVPEYLYYCLAGFNIAGTATGTALPYLTVSHLGASEFSIPDLSVQRRIADILSAYDDLIENNTRRIAILEDMARRLFDAWFGRDADSGEAEPVRIDALIDFDPKTKVAKEGWKPFLPMPCVPTNSMVVSDWEEREGNAGSKFLNGDTLLARITPCLENGKTAFVDFLPDGEAGFGSTEFIVMRGREVPPEFVYCLARSDALREHAIKSMSGATGRQRVSSAAVAQFEIASPHPERLEKFGEAASPMFAMVRSLADANTNLRTTRDLLLPKLISGEIEVRAAEKELEAVAA